MLPFTVPCLAVPCGVVLRQLTLPGITQTCTAYGVRSPSASALMGATLCWMPSGSLGVRGQVSTMALDASPCSKLLMVFMLSVLVPIAIANAC
jgi:hypothetical protein